MNESREEHFEGKIAQKAIIVKEGKVLLTRDPREPNEVWELPGGRMNIDEDPRTALQREVYEELSLDCNIHEVIFMTQFLQGNEGKRAFVIVYRASLNDESQQPKLDAREVCEIRWVAKEELSELILFPEYTRALEEYFKTRNS